jgi:transcriptional regulator with XRE-family HTH domain
MLPKLLLDRMKERGLSLREAAQEIGVSHTTIARLLAGKPADIDTLDAVARWMGVPITSLIEVSVQGSDLVNQIAVFVSAYPELAGVFRDVMQGILSGEVKPEVLTDVVAYTAYRLNLSKGAQGRNAGSVAVNTAASDQVLSQDR